MRLFTRFGRRAALAIPGAVLVPRASRAQGVYTFDQGQARLEFVARHRAIFNSTGIFERFRARVELEPGGTERARVVVEVDTASATVAYPGGPAMLRSEPFFNSERFPTARFTGQAGPTGTRDRYTVSGNLEIRGITKPITMEARVTARRPVPTGGEDVELSVTGEVKRSDFGMVGEMGVISDIIRVTATVRLIVAVQRAG